MQGARADVFSRVHLPASDVSRQSLLRDKEMENRYGRDGYPRRDYRSRSPLMERRAEGGFMNDARAAYSRRDGNGDRKAWKQGGKDRSLNSAFTRQSSRYAPYGKQKPTTWRVKERSPPRDLHNEGRIEPHAHGTHLRSIGDSSLRQPSAETAHDSHKSSGKRIASQIVTPARHDHNDNITKRPRVSPRLLTFSPMEKALPSDAQIIGALNGMEIVDTINTDVELHDPLTVPETQDDDMLGEDLMEMEPESDDNVREVERKGHESVRVKPRTSSSYKSGGRSGFPLGLRNKMAGLLRRGSPQARRSSSRDKAHSEKQRPGPGKSSRGSTRKGNGLEGSKNTSGKYP
ncbi:BnaC03g54880D [Brassica napus]|uniref:BnaC03g54880D protein n=1 Tax=Brassica napus TaxID=3708 RepID=A0A078F6K9_BRANA|nr:BnaC03g54880D [Brassica napus]